MMINKVRWWIVRKLVGKRPVVMNVSFKTDSIRTNGQEGLFYKCGIGPLNEEGENNEG